MYADPKKLIVSYPKWENLTEHEQRVFLQAGYRPPDGTIMHNNLDIHYANTRKVGNR